MGTVRAGKDDFVTERYCEGMTDPTRRQSYLRGGVGGSDEEFAEDFEGVDAEGGVGVVFDVAEELFGNLVAEGTVHGDEHGLGEGAAHEAFHHVEVFADERLEVAGFGTEAEGDGQFEEEAEVEVAEVGLNGVQKEDATFAPVIEAWLGGSVLDHPVEDFAHEHGDGVLEDVASDSQQGMPGRQTTGRI